MRGQFFEVVSLTGRQRSLGRKGTYVFDHRDITPLDIVKSIFYDKDHLVYLTSYRADDYSKSEVPLLDRKKTFIVSGYVPEGVFFYSCCGAHESDPQYAAFKTNENGIKGAVTRIKKWNGTDIKVGREIDVPTFSKALEKISDMKTEDSIEKFFKLSNEEQREKLRRIL